MVGRRPLTAAQETVMDQVRITHRARLVARQAAEIAARQMVADAIRSAQVDESRAVRRAIDAGISQRRIGIEGLDTSDFATVGRVLAITEPEQRDLAIRAGREGRVRLVEGAERRELPFTRGLGDEPVARIDWEGYGEDHEPLHGWAKRTEDGYWIGAGVDELEPGTEPGDSALYIEARRAGGALADRLNDLVNEL